MANRRGKKPFAGGKATPNQIMEAVNRVRDASSMSRPGSAVHGFSMKDEARNTLSHEFVLGEKLRQKPVLFVSAGFIDPLKEITQPTEPENRAQPSEKDVKVQPVGSSDAAEGEASSTPLPAVSIADSSVTVSDAHITLDEQAPELIGSNSEKQSDGAPSPAGFFFDLTRDKQLPGEQSHTPYASNFRSPTEEPNSGDEVILFKGRSSNGTQNRHRNPRGKRVKSRSKSRKETSNTAHLRHKEYSQQMAADSNTKDEEDEALADYIANMAAGSAADSEDDFISRLQALSHRELGDMDGAFGEIPSDNEEDGTDNSDSSAGDGNGSAHSAKGKGHAEEDLDIEIDDENLARLFAKQEQLGISSDNLAIFNGSSTQAGRGHYHAAIYRSAEASIGLDASWDQPNPLAQRKGRRRKQAPAFNVSDSELEAALKNAWERDRERKKARKMERETQRGTGLLYRNVKPDDMRVKYPSGMTVDEMKHEVLMFLLDTSESIQFPPMDKHARMVLHELAHKFNIKSQSTGNHDQRRPVLYRTKRTIKYKESELVLAERKVDEAAAKIGRKYFPRSDRKGAQGINWGSGGRAGHKALQLRDGEIVGALIPEIGQENKGHAMLEKMGWAKGTGLGSLDNKGILEPVAQVVKRSKAGLG